MSEVAKFLKSTLRLPASKFPPRPPPSSITTYLSRCRDDLYAWQRLERSAASTNSFTLHDGPPYANGDLHVGHALNKIVKDIICRTKLAEGKRINYVPGWDCHGLPIELKALEKHGWGQHEGIDPVKIRSAARNFALNTIKKQQKGFKQWAVMGDWEGHWKTMDKDFELRQLAIFKAMVEHGLVYRKHKPVYWSPSSKTALAEAELEYTDNHISTAAIVKFRAFLQIDGLTEPVYMVIWTTTPWTLPANQAIAVNKDFEYVLVHSQRHGNLIVAKSRLQFLQDQLIEDLEIVIYLPGDVLVGGSYFGLSRFHEAASPKPVVHADFVTSEGGTGLVHCAPGHGQEDYEALQPLIRDGRVEVAAPVDDDGCFTVAACPSSPSLLQGKMVFKDGNEAVLSILREDSSLLASDKYRHKYPIDWRTKQPIMIRATAQWFADISDIKNDVLKSMEMVQFLPNSGKSRLESFVKNRNEWCISRQRAWGVPIPAIYEKETGRATLTGESIDHIVKVINERGIDAWWSDPPDDPAWIMPGLSTSAYFRGKDTMDVWFDSGTSWSFMTKLADNQPQSGPLANVYLEGSDQHRGWFQSSILTNIAYQKSINPSATAYAPFAQLITHGFTLDGEGKKMSKSLGNVIDPDQIINGFEPKPDHNSKKGSRQVHPLGPDALRLWAASSDWTKDVVISEKVVSTVHKSLDKYRNTFKLFLGMLGDFNSEQLLSYEAMKSSESQLDRLALMQLYTVIQQVKTFLSNFEFHKALSTINEWIARDLSGFYFEAIKDIIYCDSITSERRKSAQTTLYHLFYQLQHMLGSITPLLVEESFDFTPEAIRLLAGHPLQRVWSNLPEEWNDPVLRAALPSILKVNATVKAAQEQGRSGKDKVIGQSLASDVVLHIDSMIELDQLTLDTWREILVVSKIDTAKAASDAIELLNNAARETERDVVRVSLAKMDAEKDGRLWTFCHEIEGSERDKCAGYVLVRPPGDDKCARCWRYLAPKEISADPALCERCEEVVKEYK